MSDKQELDNAVDSVAAFLIVVVCWAFVTVLGCPWWAIIAGFATTAAWRLWRFFRAPTSRGAA